MLWRGSISLVALCAFMLSWVSRSSLGLTGPESLGLGIVVAALVLWLTEAVPLFVTGALIALLGATFLAPSVGVPGETFLAPFASDISLLFLGGFVLSDLMRVHGLDRTLAAGVLARTGSASENVIGGVMVATAGLSMWMSNTAAAAMMLGLLGAVLPTIPKADPLRRALVLAVAAGANLGGMATPIGSPPNAVAMASLERTSTAPPSFAGWMLLAAPVVSLSLYAAWRLLVRWHPPIQAEVVLPAPDAELSLPSQAAAALIALTALLWLTGGLHPLSPGMVGFVAVVLAYGSGLLPAEGFRRLPWDVLGVVGGGLCLGVVVNVSGLDAQLVAALPLGGLGTVSVLILMAMLATALSTVMSNTAAANLLLPLVLALPGVNGLPLALSVAMACSVAMALPVSTPPNTLVFGTDEVDSSTFTQTGLGLTGIGLLTVLGVGLPWWSLVGWLKS